MIQKKWFHGTTLEALKKIKKEGLLWGLDCNKRETYLARNLKELESYIFSPLAWKDMKKIRNGVILAVKYLPNGVDDDYNPKWWEMIVKNPIPLSDIKVLKYL